MIKCGFSKEDSKGSPCVDVMTLVLISMIMLHEDGHDDDVGDDVYDDDPDDDDDEDVVMMTMMIQMTAMKTRAHRKRFQSRED